jgi:DNA-directed RNA polymerase specialized sigma24 family protein
MKKAPRPERQYTARSCARTEPKAKAPDETKGALFDSFVARYYPAVYNFTSRLTDDPREAVLLTHDAFNRARKLLRNRRDEIAVVTILLATVIREGLTAA